MHCINKCEFAQRNGSGSKEYYIFGYIHIPARLGSINSFERQWKETGHSDRSLLYAVLLFANHAARLKNPNRGRRGILLAASNALKTHKLSLAACFVLGACFFSLSIHHSRHSFASPNTGMLRCLQQKRCGCFAETNQVVGRWKSVWPLSKCQLVLILIVHAMPNTYRRQSRNTKTRDTPRKEQMGKNRNEDKLHARDGGSHACRYGGKFSCLQFSCCRKIVPPQ